MVRVSEPESALSGGSTPRSRVVVWRLIGLIGATAVFQAASMWDVGPIDGRPMTLDWWHLAIVYALAELAVVHFHFRTNAHSASLGEIPLVLGLFFAGPAGLLVGQLVGNALALTLGRRQPLVKLVFNLAQFTLTTGVAISVFRILLQTDGPSSRSAVVATAAAAVASLAISNVLIHVAIRLTGGAAPLRRIGEVFFLSIVGSVVNAAFGLIAVVLAWYAPASAWLAIIPPLVMYLTYRAYSAQRVERSRLQAVYQASRRLHASPTVDRAVRAAAELAMEILHGEYVELVVVPDDDSSDSVLRFTADESDPGELEAVLATDVAPWWDELTSTGGARRHTRPKYHVGGRQVDEALVAPLNVGRDLMGVFVVGNHVGDVGSFSDGDLDLLVTLADQLSVSLENGRLGDSLQVMTELKQQLEHEAAARDQFVASVSHELRTPLTGIMGLAIELWTGHDTYTREEIHEFLGLIASQSQDLSHIIEDLLVSARASNGALIVNAASILLDVEVKAVVTEHERYDSGMGIDISKMILHQQAWADPIRVRQIIRNLITNARRYGGERVTAHTRVDRRSTYLSIRDDGAGVPSDRAEAIFDPYERAHTATGTTESVGLGLAVSRTLARLMGGDLTYRRDAGWTVFELSLPTAPPN